jgi:sulfate transport system ATP-binding protein
VTVGDRVLFDARERTDVPPSQRRVGFVFQHLALFSASERFENIAYGLSQLAPLKRRDRVARKAASLPTDRPNG